MAAIQGLIVFAIAWAAFLGAVAALVDAVRHPAGAYVAAGKKKVMWGLILGVAVVLTFISLPTSVGRGGFVNIFIIASIVAVIFYFVDIRKKLQANRPPRSSGGAARGGW